MRQALNDLSRLLAGLLLFSQASVGQAAGPTPDLGNVPGAGSLSGDIQRSDLPAIDKPLPALDVQEKVRGAMKVPEGLKVKVDRFRITGASVYADALLQGLVAAYVGRELSLPEMEQAAAAVSDFYRQNGYFVASAYIPTQDIDAGVVEIAVLEGRIGAVTARVEGDARLGEARVKELIAGAAQPGAVINDLRLERGLLLLNDLPGVSVRANLAPGAATGTSNLDIVVKEGPLFTGSVDLDNYGNKYTGIARLGGTLNVNNLGGQGDLLTLRLMHSSADLLHGRVSWVLPVGDQGTRIGAAYSNMNYALGQDFSYLDAHGDANVYSLFATHPLVRSRNRNLHVTLGFDAKDLINNAVGSVSSDKALRTLMVGLNGNARDDAWGGGVNNYALTLTAGDLERKALGDANDDALHAQTEGGYAKLNFSLDRLQYLDDGAALCLAVQGQLAGKNLDASEKMTMGGPHGVRAYPQGEAAADEGLLINLEGRWAVPLASTTGKLQVLVFVDAALVRLHKDPWTNWQAANANAKNTYALAGAGVGFDFAKPGDYAVRGSVAVKIDDNPGQDANGQDSDNTSEDARVWLQAVKWF